MKRCVTNHGVHKFHLDNGVWRCANCSWFVYIGLAKHLVNRQTICWECNNPFMLDEKTVMKTIARPVCGDCKNPMAVLEKYTSMPKLSPEEQEIAQARINAEMFGEGFHETNMKIEAIKQKYAKQTEEDADITESGFVHKSNCPFPSEDCTCYD